MGLDDFVSIELEKTRNGNVDNFIFRIGERIIPAAFVSINRGNVPKDPDALPILLGVLFAKVDELGMEYPGVSIRYDNSLLDPNNINGMNFDYYYEGEFNSLDQVHKYLSSAGITDNNPLIDGIRLERAHKN